MNKNKLKLTLSESIYVIDRLILFRGPDLKNNRRRNTMGKNSNANNHSNQLNPNNDAYWESRGHDERPEDWEEEIEEED